MVVEENELSVMKVLCLLLSGYLRFTHSFGIFYVKVIYSDSLYCLTPQSPLPPNPNPLNIILNIELQLGLPLLPFGWLGHVSFQSHPLFFKQVLE